MKKQPNTQEWDKLRESLIIVFKEHDTKYRKIDLAPKGFYKNLATAIKPFISLPASKDSVMYREVKCSDELPVWDKVVIVGWYENRHSIAITKRVKKGIDDWEIMGDPPDYWLKPIAPLSFHPVKVSKEHVALCSHPTYDFVNCPLQKQIKCEFCKYYHTSTPPEAQPVSVSDLDERIDQMFIPGINLKSHKPILITSQQFRGVLKALLSTTQPTKIDEGETRESQVFEIIQASFPDYNAPYCTEIAEVIAKLINKQED